MKVVPLKLSEANAFVLEHHRHSKPTVGHRLSLGCEHDGELVGVAIVGRPVSRMIEHRFTSEVLRTCTNGRAPKGAVSFLYSACRRVWFAMGGTKLITYTLQRESGASLRGAGWRCAAEVRADEWNCQSRPRGTQEVYAQEKFRWEITT
jgi:hypothetical protein